MAGVQSISVTACAPEALNERLERPLPAAERSDPARFRIGALRESARLPPSHSGSIVRCPAGGSLGVAVDAAAAGMHGGLARGLHRRVGALG